jgi:predicted nucleotidyltransferase
VTVISESDRRQIIELGREFGVKRILLFGSSADAGKEPRDIDLAVEGVPDALFFRFYGELLLRLSKPVDVVDLAKPSRFSSMIREEGIPLYG